MSAATDARRTVPVVRFTVRGAPETAPAPTGLGRPWVVVYDGACKVCGRIVRVLTRWDEDLLVMPGGDLDVWRPYSKRFEVQFAGPAIVVKPVGEIDRLLDLESG